MCDEMTDSPIPLGTARGIPLEGSYLGMRKYRLTQAGKPGGAWCGELTWGEGTIVWVEVQRVEQGASNRIDESL